MIYLFKDYANESVWTKITAESENEAIILALERMLKKKAISVNDICNNLDMKLINI